MSAQTPQPRVSWIAIGLLVLIGIFLAARTEHAVGLVMARRHAGSVAPLAPSSDLSARISAQAAKDSLLSAALAGERDPFRDAPAHRMATTPGTAAGSSAAQGELAPVARAVLFDRVDPRVQLSVGPQVSAWLRPGDRFKGWAVVRITPATITLAQGEQQLTLPSP